jgi:hypothetical protein
MSTKTVIGAAAIAALVCAGSVRAHHSGFVYQTTPIWISGTVSHFELKNPHTITTLEARSADGQVRVWAVEGPPQMALDRRSGSGQYLPNVGDRLEVCAFPYKTVDEIAADTRLSPRPDDSVLRRLTSTTAEGASPRLVAGHVLVTPDGAKTLWEPHGLISECMRSANDQRQSWLDLLNANAGARQLWCEQRRYAAVQSNASLKEFVEETTGLLDEPCK